MPMASAIELPERYRVTRHIASGGMATVWEVEDLLLGRVVAVKLLGAHFALDPGARARFQREARTAARVSEHPHIATIYDTGEHGDNTYIVMEYFSGGTVADRLKAAKDGGEPIPRETGLRWLHETALALDAAHAADIVHRDVKPANLLIDAKERLAVGDFGIARLADDTQMTQTGQVLGTAAYLSPEQALGRPATAASDRYALAVVAYELLTGTRPYAGGPVTAQARQHVEDEPVKATDAAPGLPTAIDAVLGRGLAKDPAGRPSTAVALVEEIERALGTSTAPTRRVAPPAPSVPAAAAGAGAAGAVPTAPTQGGRQRQPSPPREPAAAAGGPAFPAEPARRPAAAPPARAAGHAPPPHRKATPWLPIGVAGGAVVAVVAAIALASGGNGGGDADRTAATTPKQAPASSASTQKDPSSASSSPDTGAGTTTPPPASPPPAPPPAAGSNGASPTRLNDQGYKLQQAGDNEAAVPLLKRSVEAFKSTGTTSDPNYRFAIYNLAVSLIATGDPAGAIPLLKERIKISDDRRALVRQTLAKAQAQANGATAEQPED